jgi:RNA polymerase sigma-70 factor (ECF subfamily)
VVHSAEGEPSDAELLRRHGDGDGDAFGDLVRRHRDRLWAVALRTLGEPEDAADAVQEALVSAFRASRAPAGGAGAGPAAFRGEAAVSTWLHRIVVNACIDRTRRRAARPTEPLPETEPADRRPDQFAARDTALDVSALLRLLPADQRAALVLVDMYGWAVDEAALVLDCPSGTVKSRCARGRARLAAHLRAERGNPAATGGVPSPSTGAARTAAEGEGTP